MKFRTSIISASALLLISGSAIAESGTALKADTLRGEPYADAKAVANLARGDKVDILSKQGAWLKIKAPKGSGWVRLLSVKRGDSGSASGEASGVLDLASGRAGTGKVVATTGVRGLNEEELKTAKFDEEQIRKLEASSISAEQAQQFSSAGNLKARKLNYLPKPANSPGEAK
jgi:hypothetical protein